MKQNKLILALLVGACTLLAQIAGAQNKAPDNVGSNPGPGGPPPHGRPNPTEMLARTLSLTEAQKTQIQQYLGQYSATARCDPAGPHCRGRADQAAVCVDQAAPDRGTAGPAGRARDLASGPIPAAAVVGRDCAWRVTLAGWNGRKVVRSRERSRGLST